MPTTLKCGSRQAPPLAVASVSSGLHPPNYRRVYDIEDRLVRVEDGSQTAIVDYYYDPFGRRLWKEVGGTRTYFLYADEGLVGEYDAVGNEIRTYGWCPDSTWGRAPLFIHEGTNYYWYQNDAAGTPQKIIRGNGSVVWSAVYDAFGNIEITHAEIVNNLRFAGQYHDAETGLYYNWNRYYDPAIGRYVRVDPIGDGLNLYAYCFNDPNGLIDPRGLCSSASGLAGGHNVLALAGLMPVFGIVPDLADALLYLLEGDLAGLTVSGLAAVPLIGQWARAAWMANKAAKLTDVYRVAKKAPKSVGSGGRFTGTKAPWKEGATPNSVYTQYSEKSGTAIKNAVYDSNGKYIGEVNYRNHGNGYVSGHGHKASTPGDMGSAHLPENHLMPHEVPSGWSELPSGIKPHTPLGE